MESNGAKNWMKKLLFALAAVVVLAVVLLAGPAQVATTAKGVLSDFGLGYKKALAPTPTQTPKPTEPPTPTPTPTPTPKPTETPTPTATATDFVELMRKGAKYELKPISLNFSGGGPMESLQTVLPNVSKHILMPFFREAGMTPHKFWFQFVREPNVKGFFQRGGKIIVRFYKPVPADTGQKYVGVGEQPGVCFKWNEKFRRVTQELIGLTEEQAKMLSAPSLVTGGAWSRLGGMYGYSATEGQIVIVAPNGSQAVIKFQLHADPTQPNTGWVVIKYSSPSIEHGAPRVTQGCK